MKKSFFLAMAALFAIQADAAPISAQKAAKRISDNRAYHVNSRSAGQAKLTLAYTAPGNAFYAFDLSSGGYIIAPGDDRCVPVIAETESGSFDIVNIAPPAREWLEVCRKEIEAVMSDGNSPTEATGITDDISTLYSKWTAVAPLVSSNWNQSWPYNIKCPVIEGQNCMTGCVATAMAQTIRAIAYANGSGYKYQGSGEAFVEFDYSSHRFDFSIMPDIVSINDPEESMNAVADLMLACGLSVNMNYGVDQSGAMTDNIPSALIDNFGYSPTYTRYLNRNKFTAAQWESIVYNELQLGRPVIYRGSSGDSGHAFIIDGYAPAGMWHVNWGWGGLSDGYFSLSVLNPSQQGIGGSSGGYSGNQGMVRAVPPGADPGLQLKLVAGGIRMVSDGHYALRFMTTGGSLSGLTLGTAITDQDGRTVASAIFWRDMQIGATTSIRSSNYAYDFSQFSLSPGTYRIYPAYATDHDDTLEITERYDGEQHYVTLTVDSDGSYTYSNDDSQSGIINEPDLHVAEVADIPLYSGFNTKLKMTIVNNGGSDYRGSIAVDLMPADNEKTIRRTLASDISISAGYNAVFAASIAGVDSLGVPITPGDYRLRISDKDGQRLHDGVYAVKIVSGAPPTYQQTNSDISIYNADDIPASIIAGENWGHRPDTYCAKQMDADIRVGFYSDGSTKTLKTYTVLKGTIYRINGMMNINSFTVDLPFGIYQAAYLNYTSRISGKQTVRIGVKEGGLYYLPVNDKEAAVAPDPAKAYTGDITVPSTVIIDGKEYTVTALAQDAFSGCQGVTAIDIPPTVTAMGTNSLAMCQNLSNLTIRADRIPFIYRNHVAPGLSAEADIYTSASAFDACNAALGRNNTVYALIETVESKQAYITGETETVGITITPAHPAVNPAFTITSADNDPDPAAEITGYETLSGELRLNVNARHSGTAEFNILSAQPGVAPAWLTLTVDRTNGITDPATDSHAFTVRGGHGYIEIETSANAEIYSIDGRKVSECASSATIHLPAGVYIVRCGNRTVKTIVRN